MIPTLHEFQLHFYERLRQARMRGARVIVAQSPTGSGKTTVACHMAKQALSKNSRVLFLVHRRKLVDQISSRLEEFQVNHGIIMRGEKLHPIAGVQVASRDTMLSRYVNNKWLEMPQADLVIVDEAHHAADPNSEYRKILSNYPNASIILLTATPVGPEGQGLGPFAQAIECAAPVTKLVQDGHLVPVKCYAPDRKMHRGKVMRGIAGDLVGSWEEYGENKPTVLFCSRVQHSKDAVEAFNQAGYPAIHVDANTPDYERELAFAGLENGTFKIVSNVGIIREGVDVPCLACCQIYMEMNGRVGFLQAVGRIMRPFPGKTHGILIDHAGAVFRHGFPDEDSEWTLEGDTDERFKKKKEKGLTKDVNFCKQCELLFSTLHCPKCGRLPQKPPRSIFAPPPVEHRDEILTEAERGKWEEAKHGEKVTHYLRCLGVAANRNGTFAMARAIFKQKYGEWPGNDFPLSVDLKSINKKIVDVYPQMRRKKSTA
jgi:DNA repair protein RadD